MKLTKKAFREAWSKVNVEVYPVEWDLWPRGGCDVDRAYLPAFKKYHAELLAGDPFARYCDVHLPRPHVDHDTIKAIGRSSDPLYQAALWVLARCRQQERHRARDAVTHFCYSIIDDDPWAGTARLVYPGDADDYKYDDPYDARGRRVVPQAEFLRRAFKEAEEFFSENFVIVYDRDLSKRVSKQREALKKTALDQEMQSFFEKADVGDVEPITHDELTDLVRRLKTHKELIGTHRGLIERALLELVISRRRTT